MNDDDCIDETDTDYNMDTYDDECNDFREDLAKRTGLSEARVQVRICKLAYQACVPKLPHGWMDVTSLRIVRWRPIHPRSHVDNALGRVFPATIQTAATNTQYSTYG